MTHGKRKVRSEFRRHGPSPSFKSRATKNQIRQLSRLVKALKRALTRKQQEETVKAFTPIPSAKVGPFIDDSKKRRISLRRSKKGQ